MSRSIRVNGQRLWDSIMEIAEIGALPGEGCCRLTLTKEDQQGLPVGIVPKIQGIRWFKINVAGEDNHAGTMPMDNRKELDQI